MRPASTYNSQAMESNNSKSYDSNSVCACCLAEYPAKSSNLQNYVDVLKKCLKIKLHSPVNDSIVCARCGSLLKKIKAFRGQIKGAQEYIKTFNILKEGVDKITDHVSEIAVKFESDEKLSNNDMNASCEPANIQDDKQLIGNIINDTYLEKPKHDNYKSITFQFTRKSKKDKRLPYSLDRSSRICPVCSKTFVFFKDLTEHVPTHYPSHICDSCGKLCATRLSLKNHLKSHCEARKKCKLCGNNYKKSCTLREHMEIVHGGQKKVYKCRECTEKFTTFHGRVVHLINAHGHEEKRYKCSECPKRYNHGGHLRAHIRNEHRKEKNAQCEVCHGMFFNKSALRKHQVTHSKEKKYECMHCSKLYPRKSSLKQHVKIHMNEKAFVCPMCGKAFTQKVTLNKHIVTHEKISRSLDTMNDLTNMLQKL